MMLKTDEIISLVTERLYSKKYYPVKDESDWKIFGSYIMKYFGPSAIFPKNHYKLIHLHIWAKHREQIKKLLIYVQTKLFNPVHMLYSKMSTDLVLLRICISMLNNIKGLSKIYSSIIFHSIIDQYYTRKRVFKDVYAIYIQGLPF